MNEAPRARPLRLSPLAAAFGVAMLAAGCRGSTAQPTGFLTVVWRIHGTPEPGLCADYKIDSLQLVAADSTGGSTLTADAPCEDFAITVELVPDVYYIDAKLVGVGEAAISDTVTVDGVEVFDDTDVVVEIDYPPELLPGAPADAG